MKGTGDVAVIGSSIAYRPARSITAVALEIDPDLATEFLTSVRAPLRVAPETLPA